MSATESMQALLETPPTYRASQAAGSSLLCRAVNVDGDLVTQASLSSIFYHVYDTDDNDKEVITAELTIADVIYDAEQSGDNWPYSDGYNFRWDPPITAFPEPRLYAVEVVATPTSGVVFLLGPGGGPFYVQGVKRRSA